MTEKFKIGIGVSQEHDSLRAGEDAISRSLKNLGTKPNLVLLFATINYKKSGGFQKLLDGVWKKLDDKTRLVGSTVTGFIVPEGCFTNGVIAYSISYSQMDVAIAIGKNTKKNPQMAGKKCAEALKKELLNSKYSNGFVFEFISSNTVVQMPGIKGKRVIRASNNTLNYVLDIFSSKLFGFINAVLQKGSGKEEDVFGSFSEKLSNFNIIGGSSVDDLRMIENYQFYNQEVVTNSIVAAAIKSDLNTKLNSTQGIQETPIKLNVKLRAGGRTIHKINGKPAIKEFLNLMGWPKEVLDEKKLLRHTFFFPLGEYRDNILYPHVIGWIVGNDILCGYKIDSTELRVMSSSGKDIINSVDQNLSVFDSDKVLAGMICSCATRLDSLGGGVFEIRRKLLEFFGENPFLLVYLGGEDINSEEQTKHAYENFNVMVLEKPDTNENFNGQ